MDALKVAWLCPTNIESSGLLEEFVFEVGKSYRCLWGLRWDAVARASSRGQSKCRPLLLVGSSGYGKLC